MRGKGWNSGQLPEHRESFMKSQKVAETLKNAVGTVFLLAGAFFVCSTFLSMRAVFADPIAPVDETAYATPQAARAGNTARTSGRASPRNAGATSRATVARTATNAVRNANPRATATRAVASRTSNARTATNPRANNVISTRGTTITKRNVASRINSNNVSTRAGATTARSVRARTATTSAADNARISLQGSAIRGSKGTSGTTYSYLSSKLYTGNYSNIIDSSTGLISTDAFNNCLESYYTGMDEICTARNQAQRRCGCAGRVTAFAEAEAALEAANEELIRASGELALLVANKGKDISDAFKLTDAEKIMNCVSWQEMSEQYKSATDKDTDDNNIDDATQWCQNHGIYDTSKCSSTNEPSYCSETGNEFGFELSDLNGSGSDILSQLQAWATAKENSISITTNDNNNLLNAFDSVNDVVGNLVGTNGALVDLNNNAAADKLSNKWGYDLFAHAHNEVCSRVLDSCFNGIYEACGSPTSFGGKCADGKTSGCPFNYNSKIKVDSTSGEIDLYERGSTTTSTANSATCFGYTSTTGDPYSNLRGPVADARRSIMNKYLLDANADCDAYGEQLRATAQNIAYQKVAAQQALQQKRLEFALEEEEETLTAAIDASTNFNECISEILECYEDVADTEERWTTARIKTYCAQISNVPHCYEEMICNPSTAQFKAVIDVADSEQCNNNQDYTKNTCRNIVTLNEILNGTGATTAGNVSLGGTGSSAGMREQCLLDAGVAEIRGWKKEDQTREACTASGAARAFLDDNGDCIIETCYTGYVLNDNKCVLGETECDSGDQHATRAVMTLSGGKWSPCKITECEANYEIKSGKCVPMTSNCKPSDPNASSGTQTWEGTRWGNCNITGCKPGFVLKDGACVAEPEEPEEPKE